MFCEKVIKNGFCQKNEKKLLTFSNSKTYKKLGKLLLKGVKI